MASAPIPFEQIAKAAAARALDILARWLPGGRREGHEWVALNPTRADKRPGSFRINVHNGKWGDFATDDKGGDLISLGSYLFGWKPVESADNVARIVGYPWSKNSSGHNQRGTG